MLDAGIDLIPSNDFSLYDQVLDTLALVGAVPERYGHEGDQVGLDTYFAMARGRQAEGVDVTAMEMTKWFDTNYHYIVPEIGPATRFRISSAKPFDEHAEAMQELGIDTVPVLVGPVSLLLLGKPADGVDDSFDRLTLLPSLLEVYGEVLERLAEQGGSWTPCASPTRSWPRCTSAPGSWSRPTSTTPAGPMGSCGTSPSRGSGWTSTAAPRTSS
jgi:5-methyltetrahydropteroyltriglutamate--homocysteine methyltransferase